MLNVVLVSYKTVSYKKKRVCQNLQQTIHELFHRRFVQNNCNIKPLPNFRVFITKWVQKTSHIEEPYRAALSVVSYIKRISTFIWECYLKYGSVRQRGINNSRFWWPLSAWNDRPCPKHDSVQLLHWLRNKCGVGGTPSHLMCAIQSMSSFRAKRAATRKVRDLYFVSVCIGLLVLPWLLVLPYQTFCRLVVWGVDTFSSFTFLLGKRMGLTLKMKFIRPGMHVKN